MRDLDVLRFQLIEADDFFKQIEVIVVFKQVTAIDIDNIEEMDNMIDATAMSLYDGQKLLGLVQSTEAEPDDENYAYLGALAPRVYEAKDAEFTIALMGARAHAERARDEMKENEIEVEKSYDAPTKKNEIEVE
eukprot:7631803-Heterocapsa_arctica.AAC.1